MWLFHLWAVVLEGQPPGRCLPLQTHHLFHTSLQALLRCGGIIIANELTAKTDFLTLTFGLTDGWWLYDDPQWRMPGLLLFVLFPGILLVGLLCALGAHSVLYPH